MGKLSNFILICATLAFSVTLVASLEPYEKYDEASCSEVKPKPAKNVSRAALDQMRIISAGSRNHLLRAAFNHPDYNSITEDQFQNEYCLTRNTTTNLPNTTIASAFGFGRTLVSFDLRAWKDEEGDVFVEASPREGFEKLGKIRQTITLTDNEKFAFVWTCWMESDRVGWSLVSKTFTLDEETRKTVEEHAKELGYKPENFVFLKNSKCETKNEE